MILSFVLGSPSPRGVPGEGPDCHSPKEIVGLGPIPARILGFLVLILALMCVLFVFMGFYGLLLVFIGFYGFV